MRTDSPTGSHRFEFAEVDSQISLKWPATFLGAVLLLRVIIAAGLIFSN